MDRLKALQWPDLMTGVIGLLLAAAAWRQSGPIVGVVCLVLVGLVVLYLGATREIDKLQQERADEAQARAIDAIRTGWWT